MTTALFALCLVGSKQGSVQPELHWPLVPHTLFVARGIDTDGMDVLQHLRVAEKAGVPSIGVVRTGGGGSWSSIVLPSGTAPWKTLQIVFAYKTEGPLATFGGVELAIKNGILFFSRGGNGLKMAQVSSGDLNDLQIVCHNGSLLAYLNGTPATQPVAATKPLLPIEVGIDPFKGSIIGVAAYDRELSVDEIAANTRAAKSMSKMLIADTLKVTVEGVLTGITPVPELERIRPYRSALLAEEYKVVRIVSGRMSAIKPGMKIRIFRYGIKAGEKTALQNAKLGDRAKMTIQAYDSDIKFSREFQVDNLDPDISIPLYVDVTPMN